MMLKIKFIWMLWTGVLTPAGEHEGSKMYTLHFKEQNMVIDYAYKGEIYNYIQTGEFVYDDFLEEERDIIYDWIDEEQFYTNN